MLKIDTPLTDKEQLECSEIIAELLGTIYLVRDKDKNTRDMYNTLMRSEIRDFVETVLHYCRRELIVDEDMRVAFIRNLEESDREFKKDETIILLRLYHEEVSAKTSSSKYTHVDFKDLFDTVTKTDGRKITEKGLREILNKFKNINLIDYNEKEGNIAIFPSLACLCNQASFEEVSAYIDALTA